jgi:hypothetical protein
VSVFYPTPPPSTFTPSAPPQPPFHPNVPHPGNYPMQYHAQGEKHHAHGYGGGQFPAMAAAAPGVERPRFIPEVRVVIVTCHTSHVIRHTSHVTRHTSHVTQSL